MTPSCVQISLSQQKTLTERVVKLLFLLMTVEFVVNVLNPFRKSPDVYGVYCKCILQVSIVRVYCQCLL